MHNGPQFETYFASLFTNKRIGPESFLTICKFHFSRKNHLIIYQVTTANRPTEHVCNT